MCLLTSCCTFNFGGASNQSKEQKFDINTTYSSVVKILAKNTAGAEMMSGSGFAIDKNKIMTAGHVCVGLAQYQHQKAITNVIYMQFYAPDGETILETYGLRILKVDVKNDSCILYKRAHGLTPVKFIKNYSSVKLHSTVYIVGAPLGVFATSYQGQVVLKDNSSDVHYLIVDSPAAPGNSGSPVFNESGFVVGMLVAGPGNFEHLSICIPSSTLVNFYLRK